jgi:hypothetical protein
MEDRLRALRPRGGSTLFAGVVMCSNELAKPAARRGARRIIVISDGKATLGPTAASELGLLGAYLHEQGLSVATIGVGFGYNKELMSELGRQGGGGHVFVDRPETLTAFLDRALGPERRGEAVSARVVRGRRPANAARAPQPAHKHGVLPVLPDLAKLREKIGNDPLAGATQDDPRAGAKKD